MALFIRDISAIDPSTVDGLLLWDRIYNKQRVCSCCGKPGNFPVYQKCEELTNCKDVVEVCSECATEKEVRFLN